MFDEKDSVVVLKGAPADLERAAQRLETAGIASAIVRPDDGCGSS